MSTQLFLKNTRLPRTFNRPVSLVPAIAAALLLSACGGSAAPTASAPASVAPASPAAASPAASAKPATAASGAAATASKPAAVASSSAKPAAASGAASAAAKPASSGAKVVMAYSNVKGDNLAAWEAEDAGIFQKNGVAVDLQLIAGGSKTMGGLLSGEVHMALLGGGETVSATAEGADLVILGTTSPVYPYKFEAAKEIKSMDDLRGKKVGVASIGGSADIATRVVLKKANLDPSKDVSIVSLNDAQTRSAALLSGAVQAGMDSPPGTLKLEAAGLHPLVDLASQQLPAANDALIAQKSWVNANKATVQKVIDSLVQGTARAKADKPFTLGVLKKYYKNDDAQQMDAAYEFYAKEVIPSLPYPKANQYTDAIDTLAAKNDKLKNYDVTKIFDDSFVKNAADRGLDKAP
jgi:ABC-type nitrate/sulfonate/bicarbonate transport system substrate-binding protein